ncbi:MAG: MipA/OmpV family protein [Proteobacteria bacterium]|nr:MipA/OmpV family protein [Pseudomonadota bacterium]
MFVPRSAGAESEPLWELGVGLVGISLPDYNGSDERSSRIFPMPYLIYRGGLFQADRDGLHFLSTDRFAFDVSVNATPPVSSADSGVREGMPDLLPSVEVGPMAKFVVLSNADKSRVLKIRLAWRAVIATDIRQWKAPGWVFSPDVALTLRAASTSASSREANISVGPLMASRGVHDYYYSVDDAHKTADRALYEARAGYAGLRATARVSWRFSNIWFSVFTRYDDLHGASFAQSPLVPAKYAFIVGTGFAVIFARSAKVDLSTFRPDK